jgi:hypothetical protein
MEGAIKPVCGVRRVAVYFGFGPHTSAMRDTPERHVLEKYTHARRYVVSKLSVDPRSATIETVACQRSNAKGFSHVSPLAKLWLGRSVVGPLAPPSPCGRTQQSRCWPVGMARSAMMGTTWDDGALRCVGRLVGFVPTLAPCPLCEPWRADVHGADRQLAAAPTVREIARQ